MITTTNLMLVDFAGSEKIRKFKNLNNCLRTEESRKINHSICILRRLLTKRKNTNCEEELITYRASKLTRLLQGTLEGRNRTSLIVTISPSVLNLEETLSSLTFAQNAMSFKTKPLLNLKKHINYKCFYEKLQEDLDLLNDEYVSLRKQFNEVDSENKNNKEKIFLLEKKITIMEVLKNKNAQNFIFDKELKVVEDFYDEKLRELEMENNMLLNGMETILLEKEQILELALIENKSLKTEVDKYEYLWGELNREKEELTLKSFPFIHEENFEDINKFEQSSQTDFEHNKTYDDEAIEIQNKYLYRLEYLILRYEKEMAKLRGENKELKYKLKISDEIMMTSSMNNSNTIYMSNNEHNFNSIEKSVNFSYVNSTKKLDSVCNTDINFPMSPVNVASFNFSKSEIKSRLKIHQVGEFNFTPKKKKNNIDFNDHSDKILELQTEILKLKTIILKKNKKIEEVQSLFCKNDFNSLNTISRPQNTSAREKEILQNFEKLKIKYENKNEYLEELKHFFNANCKTMEKMKDFLSLINKHNNKNNISKFFENEPELINLDINNFNSILKKINNFNYKIILQEPIDFNKFLFKKTSCNQSDNLFKDSFNSLNEIFFGSFEILIKTLVAENSKIFYFTDFINKLIKIHLEQKYDMLILQKKHDKQKEIFRKESTMSNVESQGDNILSTTENVDEFNEIELVQKEKENFLKLYDNFLRNLGYNKFVLNNKVLFMR